VYICSFSSSLEEEEEQEQTEEEEDESNLVFKSDHEFSPESDLENEGGEVQPTRRARTAQKGKLHVVMKPLYLPVSLNYVG